MEATNLTSQHQRCLPGTMSAAPLQLGAADLQQELHQVEARIHGLIKERAHLQHTLNTTAAAAPRLSPEEAAEEAKAFRLAQQKEVRRLEQHVAHSKEKLAKQQRELDVLLADDRARLADEVAQGAGAYYGESRKMRQALHEQHQQQQLGGAAGAAQAMRLRRLRQEEVRVKGEVQHAKKELTAVQEREELLDEQLHEVIRMLVVAEQQVAVSAMREPASPHVGFEGAAGSALQKLHV